MIDWTISLPDQVAVTGTASGLGEALARMLLESGVRVVDVDVDEPAADLTGAASFTEIPRQRDRGRDVAPGRHGGRGLGRGEVARLRRCECSTGRLVQGRKATGREGPPSGPDVPRCTVASER
jgi:hypothetical protein